MKRIAFCAMLVTLLALISMHASAQGQMSVGAGIDIMLPMGNFGNAWSTGFGGTGEFDYAFSEQGTCITGKIGYLTWSGKSLPSGISASYGAVPLLVGVKYYPHLFASQAGSPIRVYGHLELGFMFGSTSYSGTYTGFGYAGFGYSGSTSKTDFTIVPSVGMEIPAGPNGAVDLSIRYFDIASNGSIGLRGGYKLNL